MPDFTMFFQDFKSSNGVQARNPEHNTAGEVFVEKIRRNIESAFYYIQHFTMTNRWNIFLSPINTHTINVIQAMTYDLNEVKGKLILYLCEFHK